MSCVSRRLATSASDFVNSPTAAAQYFLHDPKLSVLAHYLRSKTPNLYKSWEYYLMVYVPERARMKGGNTCIHRTPDLQRKQPKPVRAARLFFPESKCVGTGITCPFCMFIPLFSARTYVGRELH